MTVSRRIRTWLRKPDVRIVILAVFVYAASWIAPSFFSDRELMWFSIAATSYMTAVLWFRYRQTDPTFQQIANDWEFAQAGGPITPVHQKPKRPPVGRYTIDRDQKEQAFFDEYDGFGNYLNEIFGWHDTLYWCVQEVGQQTKTNRYWYNEGGRNFDLFYGQDRVGYLTVACGILEDIDHVILNLTIFQARRIPSEDLLAGWQAIRNGLFERDTPDSWRAQEAFYNGVLTVLWDRGMVHAVQVHCGGHAPVYLNYLKRQKLTPPDIRKDNMSRPRSAQGADETKQRRRYGKRA